MQIICTEYPIHKKSFNPCLVAFRSELCRLGSGIAVRYNTNTRHRGWSGVVPDRNSDRDWPSDPVTYFRANKQEDTNEEFIPGLHANGIDTDRWLQ